MLARIAIIFIDIYRKINIFRPSPCRFYPTCSQYAKDSIVKFGVSGIFIALIRIMRCNQLFKGGYDPIP